MLRSWGLCKPLTAKLGVVALLYGTCGAAVAVGGEYERISIGYSSAVLAEVDVADAEAATKLWTDRIIHRKGYDVESETRIFPDLLALEVAVTEADTDLVFLLPQEFLALAGRLPLVPVAISAPARGVFEKLVLLVRGDSGLGRLADLRGRCLLVETDQRGTVPMLWLETLLLREGEPADARAFFASVKATRKASQTVMPVFFGQAAAGVTTLSAFQTLAELNPQLAKQLKTLAVSPGYAAGVGCLTRAYGDRHPTFFADNLAELHRDPQGRQILTLFRKGRLGAFEPGHLATVEELLREHGERARAVAWRP